MENANHLIIRPALPTDIPQMMDLLNSQYNRKKNAEYFHWQYFESYYPTVSICAFDNDKLVGMFGLQKRTLATGEPIGQLIDLLIAPDWRRKGLFASLAEKAYSHFDGLDAFCVLPNLNGKNACEKSLGFKNIAKIDSLVLEKDSLHDSLPDFSDLSASDSTLIRFDKNERLFKWRFNRNPEYEYEKITAGNDSFAIVKIFTDPVSGEKYGDIVEYGPVDSDPQSIASLFLKAGKALFEKNAKSLTTWALPHTNLYKILIKLNFKAFPQERYFCVKSTVSENIQDWHLMQADTEVY
jgi:hypothetical protein